VIAGVVASAAAFSCRLEPGLGQITLQRRGALHVVDPATCREAIRPGRLGASSSMLMSPDGTRRAERVGLDGSLRRLTSPPRGSADESPRISRTGDVLLFVRMRRGNGTLYALRGTPTVGPLLFLGNNIGYYGHHAWWLTAEWSRAR
jgi:hypothetical protein